MTTEHNVNSRKATISGSKIPSILFYLPSRSQSGRSQYHPVTFPVLSSYILSSADIAIQEIGGDPIK
jgi:hypothetical protein